MKLSYILHNLAFFLGFTKTYHKQSLYRLFDLCNQRYFGGMLPRIKILVNNDLWKDLGQLRTMIKLGEANYEPLLIYINLKDIESIKSIEGNNNVLMNIMVHEMVHLWEYCYGGTLSENWVNAYRIWLTELRDIDFSNNKNEYERIWDKIRDVLGHGRNDIHSEMFIQKCHELNEKFPELYLNLAIGKPRL